MLKSGPSARTFFIFRACDSKFIQIIRKRASSSSWTVAQDFSSTIAQCQSNIKAIEAKIDQLIRLKGEVISSTGQEERDISNKINSIVNSVNTTQNQMDKLIKELKAMLSMEQEDKNDPEIRIKNNLFGSMLKKYQNTCMRFQREESDIKNLIETKLVRAAEIAVNQELTEEQRKEVIENPQMIQQMYENVQLILNYKMP